MGTAILLGDGSHLALVELPPLGPGIRVPLGSGLAAAATRFLTLSSVGFPAPLLEAARRLPKETRFITPDPRWQASLAVGLGRPVGLATASELRAARTELDRQLASEDRPFYLALAERTLERALAAPEEVLISLAREEERLERALGREARAADAFIPVPGPSSPSTGPPGRRLAPPSHGITPAWSTSSSGPRATLPRTWPRSSASGSRPVSSPRRGALRP